MKIFKKIILLFLTLPFLVGVLHVSAQTEKPAISVQVELWPEFDRPSMLVIYHIFLRPDNLLPHNLSLSIPSATGGPHAVAYRQADGSLANTPYVQEKVDEWIKISLQVNASEIQIEYYDPSLKKTGDLRDYSYIWPGDFSVDEYSFIVQKPTGAENMQIIPGMATTLQRDDGLTYYHMNVGPLSKGQSFEIKIRYQKLGDTLTIDGMSVAPSVPLDEPTAGTVSISSNVTSLPPWIFGFIGLLMIIGGGVWYWRSGGQKDPIEQRKSHRRSSPSPTIDAEKDEAGNIYCPQCGKRALEDDRFCRVCGAPLH